jgi:hypothetical protein
MSQHTSASWRELLIGGILCATFYYLIRLPLSPLALAYYDDGENLYHTLSLLQSEIPYLQDYNHHFIGYLLPLYIVGACIGFTPDLYHYTYPLIQGITGMLVIAIVMRSFSFKTALAAALLVVTAREPYMLGHYIQITLNPIWLGMLLCSMRFIERNHLTTLIGCGLLWGLGICSDQRTVFFGAIPLIAILVQRERSFFLKLSTLGLCAAILPTLALASLWYNGALLSWYEQTIYFPSTYRVASSTPLSTLKLWLENHRYLITETPILALLALSGLIYLILSIVKKLVSRDALLIASTLPALSAFIALGGRDYDYYSIIALPLLGLLAPYSLALAPDRPRAQLGISACIIAQILLAPILSLGLFFDKEFQAYSGDGVGEVVHYLAKNSSPGEKIYLLGYRLDLFVKLGRTSGYPFSSQIFYIPDAAIESKDHQAHIYPEYYERFKETLTSTPPAWIVRFKTSAVGDLVREAERYVETLTTSQYEKRFETSRMNHVGERISFTVWKRSQ